MSPEEKLANIRQQIDTIDEQILQLLDKRFDLGDEVGAIKREMNVPIFDEKRDNEVIAHAMNTTRHPELRELVQKIYKDIVAQFHWQQVPKNKPL
jgi:monofunctional chorismate mutase